MRRTRKELREAITKSADGIKNNICLGMILEVSEIFRKAADNKEYAELTDLQWEQRIAISSIMDMESAEDVSRINSVITGMKQVDERRNKR